jgi:Skp family chaperone for outer membrane proteins
MVGVVKKLADARGMDIVVDSSGTLFFKAALDLTKDALAEYDRAFPVK